MLDYGATIRQKTNGTASSGKRQIIFLDTGGFAAMLQAARFFLSLRNLRKKAVANGSVYIGQPDLRFYENGLLRTDRVRDSQ